MSRLYSYVLMYRPIYVHEGGEKRRRQKGRRGKWWSKRISTTSCSQVVLHRHSGCGDNTRRGVMFLLAVTEAHSWNHATWAAASLPTQAGKMPRNPELSRGLDSITPWNSTAQGKKWQGPISIATMCSHNSMIHTKTQSLKFLLLLSPAFLTSIYNSGKLLLMWGAGVSWHLCFCNVKVVELMGSLCVWLVNSVTLFCIYVYLYIVCYIQLYMSVIYIIIFICS